MGAYIQAGICYRISVAKKIMEQKNVTYEEVLQGLSKEVDLDLYEAREIKNGYTFTLKDEVLEKGGLIEFLREQYKSLNADKRKVEEIINRLEEATTADEIIEFAEEKRYGNFQYSSVYDNIYCKTWGESVMVKYELTIFMLEGKIIMEAYRRYLKYIENLIKKDNPYLVSKAIKVVIG